MTELLDTLRAIITPQLFVSLIVLLIVVHVILITVAYSVYLERKISAYIQDRIGPNRVGFDFGLPLLGFLKGMWGLGQPLADGIKFLLKEDYRPRATDMMLFTLAPIIIITPALIGFAIIPWGGHWLLPAPDEWWIFNAPVLGGLLEGVQLRALADWALGDDGATLVTIAGANINVGIIYLLAVASLGVYGVTLGGWASNNKYSFLGGLRATAQMISYEIPLGLSLLAVLLVVGTLNPMEIIAYQTEHGSMLLTQPVVAIMFFICILAEANRAPFDNAEAEQELVGGYHTEYSSMRFALFFLAEYAHMVTSSAFFMLLFMGGFDFFGLFGTGIESVGFGAVLVKFVVYLTKVVLAICFMMLIRWTLPRMRYDQIMMLGWQSLIPISLVMVVVTSVMVYLGQTGRWPLLGANLVVLVGVWAVQNTLPRSTSNKRVPLYGSRYCPVPGTAVSTRPTDPMALEDRPVQGTAPVAG